MRILHILNDVTDRGNGIVNTAVDLAIEQARQGHVVAVVSAGEGYEDLLQRKGVLHLQLNQSRRPDRLLRSLCEFRRYIAGFRPDVVHAHMRTGLLLAWFWRRFCRFALVAQVHNVHDRESLMMGLADRVIAVSHSVAKTMEGQGIAGSRIQTVLNRTLCTPRLPPLAEVRPAALSRPAIVTVCGMNHRKGISELLDAFEIAGERFPKVHLYLVGNGPQRNLFEQQARASRWCDRIHFEGFQIEPRAWMLSADIFVLASRRESFGLVLIEAREAGCAIVATEVDGIAEALDDGQAGFLVPPRNPEALADAFCALLESEEQRKEWKARARQGIESFHLSIMAAEVQQVYEDLLRQRQFAGWPAKRSPISVETKSGSPAGDREFRPGSLSSPHTHAGRPTAAPGRRR